MRILHKHPLKISEHICFSFFHHFHCTPSTSHTKHRGNPSLFEYYLCKENKTKRNKMYVCHVFYDMNHFILLHILYFFIYITHYQWENSFDFRETKINIDNYLSSNMAHLLFKYLSKCCIFFVNKNQN